MCGRYNIIPDAKAWLDAFDVALEREIFTNLTPRYNVTPSLNVPVVRIKDGKRAACMLRWGLVPSWAKDKNLAIKLINARGETAHEKPSFRSAFMSRRCLMPASGWYEWKVADGKKQPYAISPAEPFAFAGLWEFWKPEGLYTCSILTTAAAPSISNIHDRMPLVLQQRADFDQWLTGSAEDAKALIKPFDGQLTASKVSTRVNNPNNDDAACLEAIA